MRSPTGQTPITHFCANCNGDPTGVYRYNGFYTPSHSDQLFDPKAHQAAQMPPVLARRPRHQVPQVYTTPARLLLRLSSRAA